MLVGKGMAKYGYALLFFVKTLAASDESTTIPRVSKPA